MCKTPTSAWLSPCQAILLIVPDQLPLPHLQGHFLKTHVFLLENCGQQQEELKASTTPPANFSTSVSPNLYCHLHPSPRWAKPQRQSSWRKVHDGPKATELPPEQKPRWRAELRVERGECGANRKLCITKELICKVQISCPNDKASQHMEPGGKKPKTGEQDGGSSRLVTDQNTSMPLSPMTYRRKPQMGKNVMQVGTQKMLEISQDPQIYIPIYFPTAF